MKKHPFYIPVLLLVQSGFATPLGSYTWWVTDYIPSWSSISPYIPKVSASVQIPSISVNWSFNTEEIERKAEVFYETLPPTVLDDASLKVPELIRKYGYPCEVHHVTTPDGYILTLHRIPHGRSGSPKNRPAVYVQHGLLSSSADWLLLGPDKALGYILADAGYDVWLANNRGNSYSRNHTRYKTSDSEYWNFSWHEIGTIDVPTMIDYVLNKTEQNQVFYIGHSQGTTAFFVLCSMKPEYNDKIKVMVGLSPVAYMSHVRSSFLKMMSYGQSPAQYLLDTIGVNEFLPRRGLFSRVSTYLCNDDSPVQVLCLNSLFAICGFSKQQINTTLVPVIMAHTPAGSSTRQLLHFAQEINSGEFRQWDYGWYRNIRKYGKTSPPKYNLYNVRVPIYLFYGKGDWLSNEPDIQNLFDQLENGKEVFLVKDPTFNHVDYLFGIDAKTLIYDKILELFKQYAA